MVMPRSRSSSFESITRSMTVSFERNVPLCLSMASTSVVFPWSTCAMMAMFRVLTGVDCRYSIVSRGMGEFRFQDIIEQRLDPGADFRRKCGVAGARRDRDLDICAPRARRNNEIALGGGVGHIHWNAERPGFPSHAGIDVPAVRRRECETRAGQVAGAILARDPLHRRRAESLIKARRNDGDPRAGFDERHGLPVCHPSSADHHGALARNIQKQRVETPGWVHRGSSAAHPAAGALRSYFASSSFATVSRCTSSGPSASRRVREFAHIAAYSKSWETPAPPCACIARSMTRSARLGATTLIIAISARAALLPARSIVYAALKVNSRACSISIREFAISVRMTPCSASGLPNATRDFTLRHIISSARSATPISRMQ